MTPRQQFQGTSRPLPIPVYPYADETTCSITPIHTRVERLLARSSQAFVEKLTGIGRPHGELTAVPALVRYYRAITTR